MESVYIPLDQKKIALPNKLVRGKIGKDRGKRINLKRLHDKLKGKETLNPNYDTRSNPFLNYLEIKVTGSIWVYANGTAKTNLNLPDESLLILMEKLYYEYMEDCLEESK